MRERGIIKLFNSEKGYGFIRRPDNGVDEFFHINQVGNGIAEESIEIGAAVEFEVIPGRDGRSHAANLTLCEGGN